VLFAPPSEEDLDRLSTWVEGVRATGLHRSDVPLGYTVAAIGEQALGTPYAAFTLEQYLHEGGSPWNEPLSLTLTGFDCVTLVETCIALARIARGDGPPTWTAYAREMQGLRYRGGRPDGYLSRLHYFSDWIADNTRRGALRDLGRQLGGEPDTRPLRFMSRHRDRYPALADEQIFEGVREHERRLDDQPRWVVPTQRLPDVEAHLQSGDVIAFATSVDGLDAAHTAIACRDGNGVLRVLHADRPAVEITTAALPDLVAAARAWTGILIARPVL
jgi:cell wall-associated NlpC family hydrolase